MSKFVKSTIITPLILSLIVIGFGCVIFLSSWAYSENGHDSLLMAYIIMGLVLFAAIFTKRISLAILVVLLMGSTLLYSSLKFEWREAYVTNTNKGAFFKLDPYITSYPTYEEHIFASLLGEPRYVDFVQTCMKDGPEALNIDPTCNSVSAIEKNYNFNVNNMITNHYQLMKKTAQRIEQGRIKNKKQFEACLSNKTCAEIPLLPKGIEAEQINPESNLYLNTRQMFWDLIDREQTEVTPALCEYITLCRAMRDNGVIVIATATAEP